MTDEELEQILARGHETDGVEFKNRGVLHGKDFAQFRAKFIRAVLGMANRRDGGHVIIGVNADTLEPEGLDEDQIKKWLNYDQIAAFVNEYATPSIGLEVEARTAYGSRLAVVTVHEFDDIPILCRKQVDAPGRSSPPILRPGACYVRSSHKPETSEIPSEQEMRELLELAIDKGVRKFVDRTKNVGLVSAEELRDLLELAIEDGVRKLLETAQRAGWIPVVQSPTPDDEGQFDQQSEELG